MKRLEFKRLNFFKGLFTKADDWKQEQSYHIEKHKLHNRSFHSPGIVRGEHENLGVIVTDDGSIKIRPGCAVDGHGNELYLAHTHDLPLPELNRHEEHMEVLHYIFIEYHQEYSEERENYQNPNFNGPALVVERPSVGWTTVAPDNNSQIELARIGLKAGRRITQKEISTKHVRFAESKWPGRIVFIDNETRLIANPPLEGTLDFDQKATRRRFAFFPNPHEAAGAFYVANVHPIEFDKTANARIMWRIESSITENGGLGYFLVMKNFGKTDVTVRCEVCQMNFGLR